MNAGVWWTLVALLAVAAAVWPRHGVVARVRRRAALRAEEQGDNALKHLLQEAQAGRAGSFASLKGTLRVSDRGLLRVLGRLRGAGLTASEGGSYTLTPLGEQRASETQALSGYAWQDRNAGTVRIPIDRAKDLLLERGLPTRPGATAAASAPAATPASAAPTAAPAAPAPARGAAAH